MIPGLDKLAAEPKTEYVPKSHTPGKRCSGCEHYVASEHGCNGPKMIAMSGQPRLPDGNVKVAPAGWCRFWEGKVNASK